MTGRTVIVALTAGQFQKIAVGPVMEVTRFKTMIDKLPIVWQQGRMRPNFIHDIRILLIGFLLVITAFTAAIAADKQIFEAEAAEPVGGASKVADGAASGGFLAGLTKPGQGVKFAPLRAASKLAIRYASVEVGTISVAVNGQPARKLNVHSSGSLTGSFLHAIIDVAIPANAQLTISLATNDVAVNIDRIIVGDGDLGLPPDIWNLPPLPVAPGPYSPDWKAISRIYTVPQWWRDAKFGAWAHWDPQSMPEQGDWYARGMYIEGSAQYNYHLKHFGHPSEYGYKDICHNWVIDRWRPDEMMDLFVEMGARYFMAMGVHHDNFDCWDSAYQPWNSVRVGPKVDIVGAWEKAARRRGLRFGIGFHNSPARTWGQFMPVRYTSDKKGSKQGVPYDALQTILDGKGKWWEGMDPADLYGPVHTDTDPLHSPFAGQFMCRVDDAITKYHPDVIYFDEHAGDSQVDLGVRMGLGFLAPPLVANYYNKSLKWNNGKMDVVINLKGVGGRYNSFQNSPELLPFVDRSLVKSTEAFIESRIMAYPFQTETSIAAWHYQTGQGYMDARSIIRSLMQNVSRNGTMLLNITQHGRGDLDPQVIRICKDVGAWLKINGEAVYGSRPFEVFGENSVCYTRNNGNVYATLLDWQGGPITLKALRAGGTTLGKVSKVDLLGSDLPQTFVQDEQGLTVTPGGAAQPLPGIANQRLAAGCRVLRITHDKGWINDDDPGAVAAGWVRRCNLGTGDFNNDLTTSDTPGDVWSSSFAGASISVIAPKEAGAGKIEIQIDGKSRATADLSTTGARQPQQVVFEETGLTAGNHRINIVNRGPGPVAVDALIAR
ncbi:MAG: alpha-L-fucosidase [Verrucomicrobiota bacterium]